MGHFDAFNNDLTKKNTFHNLNNHLNSLEDDYFYHLYLGKNQNDLKAMFGDVKVILICSFLHNFILCATSLVCLHGRYIEAHAKICTLHEGLTGLPNSYGAYFE